MKKYIISHHRLILRWWLANPRNRAALRIIFLPYPGLCSQVMPSCPVCSPHPSPTLLPVSQWDRDKVLPSPTSTRSLIGCHHHGNSLSPPPSTHFPEQADLWSSRLPRAGREEEREVGEGKEAPLTAKAATQFRFAWITIPAWCTVWSLLSPHIEKPF